MTLTMIFFSWFIVGFVSMVALWIYDMRRQEFDRDYFNEDVLFSSLLCCILGYFTPIMIFIAFESEHRWFTKLIYKIANIGIKKDD